MADTKISDLAQLSALPDATDELVIVDKSDTTMAASGTNKRIQFQNLNQATGTTGVANAIASSPVSSAAGATGTYYVVSIFLYAPATLSGVIYRIGDTANGAARSSLWDAAATTRLANRTSGVTQSGANNFALIAFDSQYVAAAGKYHALLWFSSATGTWMGARYLSANTSTGTNAGATPTSIVAPGLENADRPIMSTY